MDSMEGTTQGWWRPSPGSVYPLLESMTSEGLVKKRQDGRYEITDIGRKETSLIGSLRHSQPRSAEEVVDELSSYVAYLEDLKHSDDKGLSEQGPRIGELRRRLAQIAGDGES
jgi:DNA-binding PadR family transcriptional regulator